jgi:ribosome-associated protein
MQYIQELPPEKAVSLSSNFIGKIVSFLPAQGQNNRSVSKQSLRRCAIATELMEKTADRVSEARQFAIEAARLAANTKCHNVVVLDVRGLSPVTDFYVIATGTSARQMKTVMQELEELGDKTNMGVCHRSGYEGQTWLLCDMVDVVVHVFEQEARMYYDLESLWGDAPRLEWREPA